MSTYVITAVYTVTVVDEVALREAAFHARMTEQGLSATYRSEDDDTVQGALEVLLGHGVVTTVPGAAPVAATVSVEAVDDPV